MGESAQALEDITRWLGLAVTLIGAVVIDPDATRHFTSNLAARARAAGHQVRAKIAKAFPGLVRPRHINVNVGDVAGVIDGVVTSHARGRVNAGEGASIEHRVELLEQLANGLHDEVGQLQIDLRDTESRLRSEYREALQRVEADATELRAELDAYRQEATSTGASALPVIVVGIVLAGVAPDTQHGPWWLWVAGIVAACTFAGVRATSIWMESRDPGPGRL